MAEDNNHNNKILFSTFTIDKGSPRYKKGGGSQKELMPRFCNPFNCARYLKAEGGGIFFTSWSFFGESSAWFIIIVYRAVVLQSVADICGTGVNKRSITPRGMWHSSLGWWSFKGTVSRDGRCLQIVSLGTKYCATRNTGQHKTQDNTKHSTTHNTGQRN